jgi:hypothetical protein
MIWSKKETKMERILEKCTLIIHQIKSWIRTVPIHVSKKHIQSYFYEFIFTINRSVFKEKKLYFAKQLKE